jgi:outer membrane receptor protein involved in Fe transport
MVDPSNIPCADIDRPEDEVAGVCGQPWQAVVANAGEAHILGVGLEVDYAATDNLLLGFNAEWLEAETDSTLDLNGDGIIDVEKGNPLPTVPDLKASGWIDYSWDANFVNGFGFARLQWSYTGASNNILEPVSPVDSVDANPQLRNEAYNIGDFRFGFRGETWEASAYINNLTDERAQFTHGSGIFEWAAASEAEGRAHVARRYTNRPREIGLRFMKRWGG